MIFAELVDGCNLKCALCWNRNRTGTFKQMSLETAKKIIKQYGSNHMLCWFNWGDSLLYSDLETLSEMVRATKSAISSNFSMKISDERMKALLNFNTVYVSLSGITNKVYGIYNRGGDFDLVMSNLQRLSKLNHSRIVVRWESHYQNEHQTVKANFLFNNMKFFFEPTPLSCEVEELIEGFDHPLLKFPRFTRKGKSCRIMKWLPIDVDGNYLLCCASHNVKIGLNIDCIHSDYELMAAKMIIPMCETCRYYQYWRMF